MRDGKCKWLRFALIPAAVLVFVGWAQLRARPADDKPADKAREADATAIRQSAVEFTEAFNKGDAKAVAALFTENAENREADGRTVVGRAGIEKAYAEFFKANPVAKIDVLIQSIRFPAKDMAVEEGLARVTISPKDLPRSTHYVVVHSREGGQWKMALSAEGGVGQYYLEDLDWLLGDWGTTIKDQTVKFSFTRDPKKAFITGTFTRIPAGKQPISGSIRIALDPETGRIRSWGFEDDGTHSQSLWSCDGKSWILDAKGVLPDGTPAGERIILQRAGADAITWRSIDRVAGNDKLPDTTPMRLTRLAAPKQ
ncbi:MAG TPA: SgcJ/EcaC family oxidoreductase [Gemmataceae bacterium]|nr:SgcJ/EcaC family oxidoreductase [Gemmataceae bacterium]